MTAPDSDVVTYEVVGGTALVTMNRPRYRNAQNSVMTYALDAAFQRAVSDDAVHVIVLAGNGDHFSAGHDIGTPDRDHHISYDNKAALWWDHVDKEGGDMRYAREVEVYLGMCRRWREIPKPTIAMVHGENAAGSPMDRGASPALAMSMSRTLSRAAGSRRASRVTGYTLAVSRSALAVASTAWRLSLGASNVSLASSGWPGRGRPTGTGG